MPQVSGLRSPYDRSVGGLYYLGRMLDKIRLRHADGLPQDFHSHYGLPAGLDGQICGFLDVSFRAVEARVRQGGDDAEIAEWIFTHGLRPNPIQMMIWNEHARKLGWNDRVTAYLQRLKRDTGLAHVAANTSFDLIELSEGREPPPLV